MQQGGVQLKSTFGLQIQLKSADVDKKHVLPDVPCGHLALGPLSETCSKAVVVQANVVRQHKLTKLIKIPKCQTCHGNQKPYHNQILFCLN